MREVTHDFTAGFDPKRGMGGGAGRLGFPACLPPRCRPVPEGRPHRRDYTRRRPSAAGQRAGARRHGHAGAARPGQHPQPSDDRAGLSRRARGPWRARAADDRADRAPAGLPAGRGRPLGRGRDVLQRDAARRHDHGLRCHRAVRRLAGDHGAQRHALLCRADLRLGALGHGGPADRHLEVGRGRWPESLREGEGGNGRGRGAQFRPARRHGLPGADRHGDARAVRRRPPGTPTRPAGPSPPISASRWSRCAR